MSADCVVALDVGGGTIKAAIVDDRGGVIASMHRPTDRQDGPEVVVERIGAVLLELVGQARGRGLTVRGAGVAVPGIVDEQRGVAVVSANLGWRDVPLQALLQGRLDVPVALGQDVRAGGLAEATLGAAQGVRHFLFLAIGTGIAGAVMIDGRPYARNGYAGELGHVVVDPAGPPCTCGARGCLEAIASAAAIAARYAERTGEQVETLAVRDRVEAGDAAAREVWHEAVDALATALAGYTSLLAPEVVVVGGGLAQAGPTLFGPLESLLEQKLTFQRRPRLLPAALGEQAGAIGAALLAWQLAGR